MDQVFRGEGCRGVGTSKEQPGGREESEREDGMGGTDAAAGGLSEEEKNEAKRLLRLDIVLLLLKSPVIKPKQVMKPKQELQKYC